MEIVVKRFEVYLINLDPTIGSEIKKTWPCLVISPDEMNRHIATVIVAPMTRSDFNGKVGQIVLDQIRTVDKIRLVKKLVNADENIQDQVLTGLADLFGK